MGELETRDWRLRGGSAVAGEYSFEVVLMDFSPACTGSFVVHVHKAGMQISGERVTFIEDQGDTVVTVTGRVKDFSIQADAGEEFSAVFQFHNQVFVWCDGYVGKVLSSEVFCKRNDEVSLTFR